jgi:hypothetical protein
MRSSAAVIAGDLASWTEAQKPLLTPGDERPLAGATGFCRPADVSCSVGAPSPADRAASYQNYIISMTASPMMCWQWLMARVPAWMHAEHGPALRR